MPNSRDRSVTSDRILVVEQDPAISDLIGRQALQAMGYQIQVATDGTTAIAKALQWAPDLILIDLNLPGLSGKDLMVALASQGVQVPLIVIAPRGSEADLIQTFRLGAGDYLLLPVREAEVVNAVTRALQQVHDRRERDRLAQQLQQANQEMQLRVRELTTIFSVGKAMTSITDQAFLLDKILDAAIRTTQADLGWFLLRDEVKKPFVIVAERNLPLALGVRMNQPWDDGISSLVAMSGETLSIHGDPLRRFKVSGLGMSALIVPIKAQKTVIGLLVMLRKAATPFGSSEHHLLEALADYAAISLVNVRLFRALEERARQTQQMADTAQLSGKVNNDILRQVKDSLAATAFNGLSSLEQIAKDPTARWRSDQRQHLSAIQDALRWINQIAGTIDPVQQAKMGSERARANLNEVLGQSLRRQQPFAQQAGLTITLDNPGEAVLVPVDAGLVLHVLDSIIGQIILRSKPGGQVRVKVEKNKESRALLNICCSSLAITLREAEKLFEEKAHLPAENQSGGPGIQLSLAREIIIHYDGKISFESPPGKEAGFQIMFPTF